MKRKINGLKLGAFLIGISLLLWNCENQEENLELNQSSEYIQKAKNYFNNISLTEHQQKLLSLSENINWNNSQIFKKENDLILEIFLNPKKAQSLKSNENTVINFHNRILFSFNKNKKTTHYFATIISPLNSLNFISNKENISYSNISKEFSGSIIIKNKKDKSFINEYVNGVLQTKSPDLYARVEPQERCYQIVERFSDGSVRIVPNSRFCLGYNNDNNYGDGYHGGRNNNGNNGNSTDDKIINELTGKAKCVYENLEKLSTNFKNAIQKFDGDFPVSHLNLIMEDLGNTRGETRAPNGAGSSPDYVITIAINSNSNIHGVGYRPNLMTAKTIAHEVIHAEMFRKLLSLAKQGNLDFTGWSSQQQKDYIISIKKDFPGIYDYYRRHKNWQHQQMATHYRQTIADILSDFDNNQHSNQFYLDTAWEGLIKSNIYTWTSLSKEEQDRIKKVISDYINLNKNETCQ
ncbi:hypothetical protein [uncultured Tenacibaculum sp.]|uniref:hypothetical protein n=1 Tax=uncultured Tenacibaculum sp. TaxID=174713 RepID=UPI00260A71B3|nr:hypothetical protein [uncultured Tenacibaculum sp.]